MDDVTSFSCRFAIIILSLISLLFGMTIIFRIYKKDIDAVVIFNNHFFLAGKCLY